MSVAPALIIRLTPAQRPHGAIRHVLTSELSSVVLTIRSVLEHLHLHRETSTPMGPRPTASPVDSPL